MSNLNIITQSEVNQVFTNYPEHIREKLTHLRTLIIDTAAETDHITDIEETLKWGGAQLPG